MRTAPAATPIEILRRQATTFIEQLSPLYDGNADAVHAARVASRRIREVVPLRGDWYREDAIEELEDIFRRVGKKLGRALVVSAAVRLWWRTRPPQPALPDGGVSDGVLEVVTSIPDAIMARR